MGYLINELNRDDFLPYESLPRKLDFSIYLTFTILFSALFLISILVIFYKKLRYTYQALRTNDENNQHNHQQNEHLNETDI